MKSLMRHPIRRVFAFGVLFSCCVITFTAHAKDLRKLPGIPPDIVTSYIHSVIQADRVLYSKIIVDRLHEKKILSADEEWEQKNLLPLPAQILQESGNFLAENGGKIRYRLVGLWPIYARNAPLTDFEKKGLEAIAKKPNQPYSGVVKSGMSSYFQAIYADKAVASSCINCHNTHPLSPKRNFKLNDVMGAIVITIPLDP